MRAILLDVEGTTTPIRFVYEVLFPYARQHLPSYLEQNRNDENVIRDLELLRREFEQDFPQDERRTTWDASSYCLWLMDHDRKSTALKSIQGKVWEHGYRSGALKGEVFPDVPSALEDWHRKGTGVYIFSSGSVLAQKLLFANTTMGDLTGYFSGHFDTHVGPKTLAESYSQIAQAIGAPAADIVFISDVTVELDAARVAGMQTLLCVRPGNHIQPNHAYRIVENLEQIGI